MTLNKPLIFFNEAAIWASFSKERPLPHYATLAEVTGLGAGVAIFNLTYSQQQQVRAVS